MADPGFEAAMGASAGRPKAQRFGWIYVQAIEAMPRDLPHPRFPAIGALAPTASEAWCVTVARASGGGGDAVPVVLPRCHAVLWRIPPVPDPVTPALSPRT